MSPLQPGTECCDSRKSLINFDPGLSITHVNDLHVLQEHCLPQQLLLRIAVSLPEHLHEPVEVRHSVVEVTEGVGQGGP